MILIRRSESSVVRATVGATALLLSACAGSAGTPSEASDLAAAVVGDWTTEGGSGPSVMGLLITPSGSVLEARMRLSGVEDHATGSCSTERCTLYFARRGSQQSRLELRPAEGGTRLHVRMASDVSSGQSYDYVLVRAQGR